MEKQIVKINHNLSIPIVAEGEDDEIAFFVSVGEYPVYDGNSYNYMQEDKNIRKNYVKALAQNSKDKNVLDIGTGRDMDWALYSLDYGAKSATGVEMMEETYKASSEILKIHPYKDKMTLVNTISTEYQPEEKFDICVSEIIGTIGGSEGVTVALNDAKNRLLKEDGLMIPYSCKTLAGAVCIRDILPQIGFHKDTIPYLNQIFDFNGKPFDLRLTLTHHDPKDVISTYGVIEDLNFSKINKTSLLESCLLKVTKKGRIDGLLLWINLQIQEDGFIIDSLKQKTSWEVVYIPIFDKPVDVNEGDEIILTCQRYLDENQSSINPNYKFSVLIETEKRNHFGEFDSIYKGKNFLTKKIYKDLFLY